MARMHGSYGSVEMGTGGSPTTPVASLNAWSLSMARDRVDVTSFGDTNKQYVQGLADIKGTFGGFYDPGTGSPVSPADFGNSAFFDAAEGTTAVLLKLYPSSLNPANYWTGDAYIDASIDVSATGAVTISGSFVAAGDWTRY